MRAFRVVADALVLMGICMPRAGSAAENSAGAAGKGVRVLFVAQSLEFKHKVVTRSGEELSLAERTLTDWGVASGLFRVDCTQDVAKDFTKENLRNYDVVVFYTTGKRQNWPVDDATLEYFLNDWLKQKGHGFIGIHCATDTLADYKPYAEMIGASFLMHPWDSQSKVVVKVHEPDNPMCKPWGSEFEITDEIYEFKNWLPQNVRVLMSLDLAKTNMDRARADAKKKNSPIAEHVPIAWCREYGDGKVFYISLGHNDAVWADSRFRDSILAAVRWIRGTEQANAKPNPELDAAEKEKGKAALAEGAPADSAAK